MGTMAKLYSAMDVLLNPAMGEGFGVPVLEAQACGTPAIVTDFSAMQEVCGAGWHVAYERSWTGQNSWQASPDVDDIVSALEECYALRPGRRVALSQSARVLKARGSSTRCRGC
jgi:glycosyltransferase involved in cell wall biosynthesis